MIELLFWGSAGLIAYTYVGYPALVGLLSRLRPQNGAAPAESDLPTVTLVIAAYNEEEVIEGKLENSLAFDYPPDRLQVIVAADGSDDGTAAIAQRFHHRGVLVLSGAQRRGKVAAINRALPEATGDIVLFSDANNLFEADTLQRLVAGFADESVGAVGGAKHVVDSVESTANGEGLYWRYESFIKSSESRLSSCTGVAGEILAVRRELLDPIPEDVINDDYFIALAVLRSGYRIAYEPEARSWEVAGTSVAEEQERRARIAAGRVQLLGRRVIPWGRPVVAWQIVSHKYLRLLVPAAAIGVMAGSVLRAGRRAGSSTSRIFAIAALAGQVLFYGLAWVGHRRQRRGADSGRLAGVSSFLVTSNSAVMKGVVRQVSGGQATTWKKASRNGLPAEQQIAPRDRAVSGDG